MAKAKHVKLGEKASVFFDPSSGLKITPGQAVELSNEHKMSKRVVRAIKAGHLDYVHDDEIGDLTVVSVDDQQKAATAQGKQKETEKKSEKKSQTVTTGEGDEDEEEWDEKSLMRLKKPELVKMASENGSEYSQEELEDMNKEELTEEILSLNESEEE